MTGVGTLSSNLSVGGFTAITGNIATTSSGSLTLKLGKINGIPTNATDAFVGIQDTGGPGGSEGDLILIPRTTTGLNNAIRLFTGSSTPSERLTILESGNVGIGATTAGTVASALSSSTAAKQLAKLTVTGGDALLNTLTVGLGGGQVITNLAVGPSALFSNTTGSLNVAIGLSSLQTNTTGNSNTAIGFQSLSSNTTGTGNTAIGRQSLYANTTGSTNTAIGYFSLFTNTTGNNNTAMGIQALNSNTAGSNNTVIGYAAGLDVNTATSTGANTFIGYFTGGGIVTGVNNTILGANVTGLASTLSNNIIIADGAGNRRINVDGSGNVGIGTTTPGSLLTVAGNTSLNGEVTTTNTLSINKAASDTIQVGPSVYLSGGSGSSYTQLQQGVDKFIIFGFNGSAWTPNMAINNTTGNVGIGTSSPQAKLDVRGSGIFANTDFVNGVSGSFLQMQQVATSGNTFSAIDAYSNGGTLWNNLILQRGSGKVGIGTTTPTSVLTVESSFISLLKLKNTIAADAAVSELYNSNDAGINQAVYGSAYSAGSMFSVGANGAAISQTANGPMALGTFGVAQPLIFGTNSSEKMRINSNGNVGIGTTTPNSKLTVDGTFSFYAGNNGSILTTTANTLNLRTGATSFNIDNNAGSLNLVSVLNSGNVGIGTTTPGSLLTVAGNIMTTGNMTTFGNVATSSSALLSLKLGKINGIPSNATDAFVAIQDTGGPGGLAGDLILVPRTSVNIGNAIRMFTGSSTPSERLSILETGNVGIGTSSPGHKLSVVDSQSATYVARITNVNTAGTADGLLISLGIANATRATGNYFVGFSTLDGTVAGKIQGGAGAVAYTTTAADLAEFFPVDSDHEMPTAGEIVTLDSINERGVMLASAGSVPFGIVTTNPGFVGNGPICKARDTNCDADYAKDNALISLTGQVPLKINNENGAIAVGDSVTISSVTGVGMKAHFGDRSVGYALESSDEATGSATIRVFVANHTAFGMNPDPALLDSSLATTNLDGKTVMARIVQLVQGFVDGVLKVAGIKTESVKTQELCIGDTCVTEAELKNLLENSNQSPPPPPPQPDPDPTPPPSPDPTPTPTPAPPPPPEVIDTSGAGGPDPGDSSSLPLTPP